MKRSELRRKTRINPVSSKRKAEQRVRRKHGIDTYGDRPLCAIRWDHNCRRWADALHELHKAGQGGSRTDMSNCVPACHYCNGMVEEYPVEAHARGWVVKSWEADKGRAA